MTWARLFVYGVAVAVWLLVGEGVHAEVVSLRFNDAPVVDMLRSVLAEMDGGRVVFTGAALNAQDRATVILPNVERAAALSRVEEVAKRAGFTLERNGGVWLVDKRAADAVRLSELVYRPRHRSVTYLVDLMASLFPPGSFGYQRGVRMSGGLQSAGQGVDKMGQGGMVGTASPPVDAGDTAFSKFDKVPDVLVFKGAAEDVARAQRLLVQLDIPATELLVRAVVYEVQVGEGEESALGLALSILKGKIGLTVGRVAAGDYSALVKAGGLDAVYNALASDSRFKAVSGPRVRVQSGAKARLMVGASTPVLGASTLDRNGNAVQSVDYKPSGVILEIRPQIHAEGADLELSQQISSFSKTETGVNGSPTLTTRELQTTVGVRGDDVVILGGLEAESDTATGTGPRWLPSFFRSTSSERRRSEILLFLQADRI